MVGGEAGGESTRVDGSVGGGRFTTGFLGDVGTDMGKGSATWSGAGMVGDGEARKRAPVGFGMKESDMVCWDFFSSPINLALYDFGSQFRPPTNLAADIQSSFTPFPLEKLRQIRSFCAYPPKFKIFNLNSPFSP